MAQNNDERILSLKAQTRFVPETNCILELDGVKYNIHTVTDYYLLLKLTLLKMSAKEIEINPDDVILSGYPLTQWINDVQSKLDYERYRAEKQKLDSLERQLTNLLSDSKQTELKIDELAAMLDE